MSTDEKKLDALDKAVGVGTAAVTTTLVVSGTGVATGTAGGAAVMKTLAIAGALLGGATTGILVVGGVGAAVGWYAAKKVRKYRDK